MLKRTKQVRARLKKLRKERGTQEEVAKELGVSKVYLRHLENGHVDPSAKFMFKLGKFFNESVYNLFPDLADQE